MVPNLLLMNTFTIVMLVIIGIMIVAIVVLFFLGKKMDKQQTVQFQLKNLSKK